MVGFGPEDNHFVVELTYNYGVKKYRRGNDFQVSCIQDYTELLYYRSKRFSYWQQYSHNCIFYFL